MESGRFAVAYVACLVSFVKVKTGGIIFDALEVDIEQLEARNVLPIGNMLYHEK